MVLEMEEYTNGFVRYVDLTSLHLGVSEWVLSLEVGEHVPSEFESTSFQIFTLITVRGWF